MKYNLILCDPPWSYRDKCNAGKRGAIHKYDVMGLEAIKSLRVKDIAADDCLLAMWWVPPMPSEALEVVKAWGFTLKTFAGFTWYKTTRHGKRHFGMGNWTRANTESCLFATRGKPRRVNAGVSQFVEATIGRHSEKPGAVRERLVKLMGDVPRVELFAREQVEGWDSWGNEVDGGDEIGAMLTGQDEKKLVLPDIILVDTQVNLT